MPNVKVFNMQGAEVGQIDLADEVFAVDVHVSAMHTMVRAILNAKRQGTQSAKTRTEVRGGGRKIYRQKGTRGIMAAGRRSSRTAAWSSLPSPVPIASMCPRPSAAWR